MRMMILGVGALLMAGTAIPASAHDVNGENSYSVIRQHVRECRQHERFHHQLHDAHDQAHQDGSADNGADHADTHDALLDEHDQYHEDNGDPQNCQYWYSQYNNSRGYGYRDRHYRRHNW